MGWFGGGAKKEYTKLTQEEQNQSVSFAKLLETVALAVPSMRVRFSTSHPKDMSDDVLHVMAKYNNICAKLTNIWIGATTASSADSFRTPF